MRDIRYVRSTNELWILNDMPSPVSGVAGSYNDRSFEKGAGIILDMPLNKEKTLKELTLRTLSNDVVIGLMGVTLQRTK